MKEIVSSDGSGVGWGGGGVVHLDVGDNGKCGVGIGFEMCSLHGSKSGCGCPWIRMDALS